MHASFHTQISALLYMPDFIFLFKLQTFKNMYGSTYLDFKIYCMKLKFFIKRLSILFKRNYIQSCLLLIKLCMHAIIL